MYKFLLCMRYVRTRYTGIVCVVSVMLGVATMIVVNSVMGGFREKMRDRLHGILADIVVESTSMDGFPSPDAVMERIKGVAGDKIVAMTPTVEVYALLHHKIRGQGQFLTRLIRLVGIDPKGRAEVGEFRKHLVSDTNREDPSFDVRGEAAQWRQQNPDLIDTQSGANWRGAIIGYQIATYREPGSNADLVKTNLGQEIMVTTFTKGKPEPVHDRFIVVDYFKSDMSEYDSQYVFVPIEELQTVRGMGDHVTSIQIKLKDFRDAPEVVAAIQGVLPRFHFDVQTWEDKQGPLLQAVKVEAFILNVILSFIIAVAGFGILAIFFMIVVEKTRDIGILKSLGASDFGIMGVFIGFGLTLGLIGCILGALLGIGFSLYINPIEQFMTRWTGIEAFPRDIYYFKEIPVVLNLNWVFLIVVGALSIAVGASVFPALRAARLRPVEALRYE